MTGDQIRELFLTFFEGKEHLRMPPAELKTVTALRRRLMSMKPPQQIEQLLGALSRFETNERLVKG